MTKESPLSTKPLHGDQPVTIDAATLRNMALRSDTSVAPPHEGAVLGIAELLAQLSPTNLQLVERIVRCIFDAQVGE